MRDKAKDEAAKAVRRELAMEAGFRLFAERGIDAVTMPDIAEASGVGRPSLYRYFSTKTDLVVAIGVWKWEAYFRENVKRIPEAERAKLNAREHLARYLDVFLDLYRNHRDLLRFNYFFNAFVQNTHATEEQLRPYLQTVQKQAENFRIIRQKALQDGTLRTDISEASMASGVIHIMLAAATRYAAGLVYMIEGNDPEDELVLLRNALLREYMTK